MMLGDIRDSIRIDAPVERVWEVLTTAGCVEEWLGCIGFEAAVGTIFFMQPDPAKRAAGDTGGATHCELLELDPPRAMTFSWFLPGSPTTQVLIELSERGGGTTATLTHSGWEQFAEEEIRPIRAMLEGGWRSHVLPGLRAVAERVAA